MTVSPEILFGPRLKVNRAHYHIDEIIEYTDPLAPHWYTFGVETNAAGSDKQPTRFSLVYRPNYPIPELLAIIIGDAVHNLRCALDHLAVGIRGPKWKAKLGFPMREARKDLISGNGAPIPELDAIEAALPGSTHLLLDKIRPANGDSERFWSFHVLDNDDKHNLILPTVAITGVHGFTGSFGHFNFTNCRLNMDAAKPAEIFRSTTPITVEDDFYTTVEVKFGKGTPFEDEPVIPTLTQIAGVVTYTLDEFERLIDQGA